MIWPFGKRKEAVVYRAWEHSGWGDNITIESHYKAHGHTPFYIERGDEIHCNMKSGKIGVYKVVRIIYQDDPHDMFFADLKPLGYLDNQ